MMRAMLLGLTGLAAMTASANSFTFAARLDDGPTPASGLFTIDVALVDDDGDLIWTEQQSAVIVVDGVLALDVGAAEPLPAYVPPGAQLRLTIDDEELDPMPLASLHFAEYAGSVVFVDVAARATSLNGVDAAAAATREALDDGLPVAFGNVTGLSPTVLDGDNGVTVSSTSADFALSNRTLGLGSVNGSRLAANVVTAAKVSGTLSTSHVADGTITGAKLVDGTLPRSRLAANPTEREVKAVPVWIMPAGCVDAGYFTEATSCPLRTCTLPGGGTGFVGCDGTGCSAPFGPIAFQGRCNVGLVEPPTGELVLE